MQKTRPHDDPARRRLPLAALLALLLCAGCATRTPSPQDDGPHTRAPIDPMQVPDALPVLEPIRAGGPNKPYEVLGEIYKPLPADAALSERGLASWYGRKFHGRRTASGELYNMHAMTAAHPTLPLPSFARISNPANGRSVIVRVNDRGPFVKGRIVDLSYSAAQRLGVQGVATVELVRITPAEIRRGAWQPEATGARLVIEGDEPPAPAAAAPAAATATQRGFWVQLGAFRDRGGAQQLQDQASAALDGIAPMLAVFNENALFRLQAGPFASRNEAQRAAERVREKLQLTPLLVERR
ncbi:MAG: septal ring lytic transglycosylase RlpA family protein [Pseudomonadota bacterium]